MISDSEDNENIRKRLISKPKQESLEDNEYLPSCSYQRLVLTLLSFGDFTCFCALSIMGPLFPPEVSICL